MPLPRSLIDPGSARPAPENLAGELLAVLASRIEPRLRNRAAFLRQVAMEAEALSQRANSPASTIVVPSDEALLAHPDLVAAHGEAWNLLLDRGLIGPDPVEDRRIVVTAAGRARLGGDAEARATPVRTAGPSSSTASPPSQAATPSAITSAADIDHVTAFVSWAHGTEHTRTDNAYRLAVLLRDPGGICADIDLFHLYARGVDWQLYGPSAIRDSDFILVCPSREYRQRWEATNDPREGAGAAREARVIRAMFDRNQDDFRSRLLVVMLPGASREDIPPELDGVNRFTLREVTAAAVEELLHVLHGRPGSYPTPPVALVPAVPTRTLDARPPAPGRDPTDTADDASELTAELRRTQDALRRLPPEDVGDNLALPWVRLRETLMSREAELDAALRRLADPASVSLEARPGVSPLVLANALGAAAEGGDVRRLHDLAFDLARTLAAEAREPREVRVESGHERRGFEVCLRIAQIQWRSTLTGEPLGERPHLVRTFLTPRGETREWRLVGWRPGVAARAYIDPEWLDLDMLDDIDVRRFAREARRVVQAFHS